MSHVPILLELSLDRPSAVEPSANVLRVAGMFGLGIDDRPDVTILPPTRLTLAPHQIVFVTGASGGGKSTLLRLMADALATRPGVRVVRFDALPEPPDRPLVDCFGDAPLQRVLEWLSLAGLNDAFVMLRRPCELSDGQRYRFRLAQTLACVGGAGGERGERGERGEACDGFAVVLADEFGATLDRLTASILARNVRKWTRREAVCFVAATTHDDLLEPLEPDVLVEKHAGSAVEVVTRGEVER